MSDRRIDGFFYGLFMDKEILKEKNVEVVAPRTAYVNDYALQIGKRATLVPSAGNKAYGMVLSMTHDEIETLYGAPGLEDYRPEAVIAYSMTGESFPAICYNLNVVQSPDEKNDEYAALLKTALEKLNFPQAYIDNI